MVKRQQTAIQFKDKDKLSIEIDEPFIRTKIQLPTKQGYQIVTNKSYINITSLYFFYFFFLKGKSGDYMIKIQQASVGVRLNACRDTTSTWFFVWCHREAEPSIWMHGTLPSTTTATDDWHSGSSGSNTKLRVRIEHTGNKNQSSTLGHGPASRWQPITYDTHYWAEK